MSYKKSASLADALPHTAREEHPPLPCRKCQQMTSRKTLSDHGAQCYPCFAAYCRETPQHYRAGMPDTATVRDMKTRLRGHIGRFA